MAKLIGCSDDEYDAHILELSPITPSLDGPRDAYAVQICKSDQSTFEGTYNVHEWQLGHFYFYKMASAFIRVKELANAELDFSVYSSSSNSDIKEEPLLRLGVEWLSLFLSTTRRLAIDHPEKVSLEIYARMSVEGSVSGEPDTLKRFWMAVSIKAAEEFGNDLYTECISAENRRKELGIPALEE